jgi:hypothetical protein
MVDRKRIPKNTSAEVLANARRRCCVCVALHRDIGEKKGQIAHLDRDPSNGDPDNLVFLCLEHHDQYDSRPSQSKGFTPEEVKRYRAELPAALARSQPRGARTVASTAENVFRQFPRHLCAQFSIFLTMMPDKPTSYLRLLSWVDDLDDELLLVSAALAGRPDSSRHVAQSWISENSHPLGTGRSVPDLIRALLDVGVLAPITEDLMPGTYVESDAQRNPAWDYGRMLLDTWGLLRRAAANGVFDRGQANPRTLSPEVVLRSPVPLEAFMLDVFVPLGVVGGVTAYGGFGCVLKSDYPSVAILIHKDCVDIQFDPDPELLGDLKRIYMLKQASGVAFPYQAIRQRLFTRFNRTDFSTIRIHFTSSDPYLPCPSINLTSGTGDEYCEIEVYPTLTERAEDRTMSFRVVIEDADFIEALAGLILSPEMKGLVADAG